MNAKTVVSFSNQSALVGKASFSKRNAISIHNEAMAIAKSLKSEYQRLFEILLLVEEKQIYFEFEIPDLKTYCMELLELSDNVAKEFGIVVRKSLEVPQLAKAIREGKVSIYKARRISSVINESNHKEWIDLAVHCSSRVIEKAVAMANPKEAAPESLKYIAGDVLDFRMGVSEEWAELLLRTKDLCSQQFRRAVSSEEALFYLMSEHCRKNDPLEKAKRAEKRKKKRETKQTIEDGLRDGDQRFETRANCETQTHRNTRQMIAEGTSSQITPKTRPAIQDVTNTQSGSARKPRSRYRPAEVEHQVDLRDECQCAYVDPKGNRCQSRRWLQKHHIVEFADGGEHTVENLITLCWAHHKIKHLKSSSQSTRRTEWHVPLQM